ncbi:MAG: hypothetical protein AB8B78_00110 [Polaribacter sp.]
MYKEKTDRELIEILKIQKSLTFESQLNLKEEFNKRDTIIDISDLKNSINEKIMKIKNLDYLKNLGFQFENNNNSIKIFRTTKAIVVDVLGIIFGILLCVIAVYGLIGIISSLKNENEFNILSLIIQVGMIALGFVGIGFLNGLKRLIDYSDFELSNTNGLVTLKKRVDVKILETQKNEDSFQLKKGSELLTLQFDNIKILSANVNNIVQTMTINELSKRLTNSLD